MCDVPPFPKSLTPTYQTLLTRMKSFQRAEDQVAGICSTAALNKLGKKDLPARGEEVHSFSS